MSELITLLESSMRNKANDEVRSAFKRVQGIFLSIPGIKDASGPFGAHVANEDFEKLSDKFIDAAIEFRTDQLITKFISDAEDLNEMFASLRNNEEPKP